VDQPTKLGRYLRKSQDALTSFRMAIECKAVGKSRSEKDVVLQAALCDG